MKQWKAHIYSKVKLIGENKVDDYNGNMLALLGIHYSINSCQNICMEFSASTWLKDYIQAPKTMLCYIIWRAHKVSHYPCSTETAYHVTYCNLKEAIAYRQRCS